MALVIQISDFFQENKKHKNQTMFLSKDWWKYLNKGLDKQH